jgi:predicted NAD-dependent protein-ADP-ribosyltransferase YbiA (DUF1768 family)
MVKSKLNKDINYHEYSHLEEEDFKYNTPLFEVQLLRDPQKVVIGLGQLNYHFAKRYSVVYAPIYLFNVDMEFMKQIGVYEMPSNQIKMDESGDLDIHKLAPLLYGFVNTELLRKSRAKGGIIVGTATPTATPTPTATDIKKKATEVNEIKKSLGKPIASASASIDADGDSSSDDDTTDADTLFGLDAKQKHLLSGASILPLQTKEQSELERRQYKPNPAADLWIQKYLRNKYFNFIDNEGGSDGFFAVIRDALLTQGRTTTILELRKQLADEVTDEVFRAYREKFAMYHALIRTETRETKELVNNYNDMKRRISSIHDRAQQQLMIAGAKKLVVEHNLKHDEMKYTKLRAGAYDYMREVRSADQLKERMMTSIYWPDAWAVDTMERVLNMKFVMFSRDAYEADDIDNVLLCDNGGGGTGGSDQRKCQVFEPTAYILISRGISLTNASSAVGGGGGGGKHAHSRSARSRSSRSRSRSPTHRHIIPDSKSINYTLITYKTHGVLAFSELPYDIKLLVTTKCLENQTCGYSAIPQFKLFQRELGIRVDEIPNESLDDLLEEVHTGTGMGASGRNGAHLYTPDIVFQFYAKSNPNALPGCGPGEKIPESEKIHFHKLATFENWRRKLSNFWNEPFMLDGHTWQSVEHYYQGSKFKNNNREFYLKFSLDSRSELASDPIIAKAAGSKSGKLKNAQNAHNAVIRPSRITIDPDFFNHGRSEREMENAMVAKFSQNKGLKDLLLATRNAKLVHYQRGARPEVYQNLMRVRHKLRTGAGMGANTH